MSRIITITGHRFLDAKGHSLVWSTLRTLVNKEAVEAIYFGGAAGVDTEALKAALFHRKNNRPKLIAVAPDTVEAQPVSARPWIVKADEVVELRHPITPEDRYLSYYRRNEYMVDHSNYVVAFFNGSIPSGTYHTMTYARSKGLTVVEVRIPKST